MADLGGQLVGDIPEDDALVTAENAHRLVGLDETGLAADRAAPARAQGRQRIAVPMTSLSRLPRRARGSNTVPFSVVIQCRSRSHANFRHPWSQCSPRATSTSMHSIRRARRLPRLRSRECATRSRDRCSCSSACARLDGARRSPVRVARMRSSTPRCTRTGLSRFVTGNDTHARCMSCFAPRPPRHWTPHVRHAVDRLACGRRTSAAAERRRVAVDG